MGERSFHQRLFMGEKKALKEVFIKKDLMGWWGVSLSSLRNSGGKKTNRRRTRRRKTMHCIIVAVAVAIAITDFSYDFHW